MATRTVRLVLSDKIIGYHPILAKAFGSVTAALMLSQLMYWDSTRRDTDRWFYKTDKELTDETGLSRHEISTAKSALVAAGALKVELRGLPRRTFYLIDFDAIEKAILEFCSQQDAENVTTSSRKADNCMPESEQLNAQNRTAITENTREFAESTTDNIRGTGGKLHPVNPTEDVIPSDPTYGALVRKAEELSGNLIGGYLLKDVDALREAGVSADDLQAAWDKADGKGWGYARAIAINAKKHPGGPPHGRTRVPATGAEPAYRPNMDMVTTW